MRKEERYVPQQRCRRVRHSTTFEERLAQEAERFRQAVRELLLRRARLAKTASHMNEWLKSPGLAAAKIIRCPELIS